MNKIMNNTSMPPIQFLEVGGEEYALIPLRLLAAVEDLEDLEDEMLAARAMQRRLPDAPTVPGEVMHAIVQGTHPVKAWRNYRGLTQEELARRTGTSKAYISHIERGLRQPALALTRALAAALNAPLDVLVDMLAECGGSERGSSPTDDAA